jgi:hypothetical protein
LPENQASSTRARNFNAPSKAEAPDLLGCGEVDQMMRDWVFLSEHKWDSKIRPDQLVCYADVLRSLPADERRLSTIVAQPEQKREAEATRVGVPTTHLFWEDVYEILEHADSGGSLLEEFVDFMKAENLNPGPPIESLTMQAFLASISFKRQLMRYFEYTSAEG